MHKTYVNYSPKQLVPHFLDFLSTQKRARSFINPSHICNLLVGKINQTDKLARSQCRHDVTSTFFMKKIRNLKIIKGTQILYKEFLVDTTIIEKYVFIKSIDS